MDAAYAHLETRREKRPATAPEVRRFIDRFATFVEAIDRETRTA